MKIAKITIKNFRGISSTTIDVKDINFLIGPCGSCKTSTLEALKWALTGGVNVEDIKIGEAEAYVEIEFEDGTMVSRCRNSEKNTVKVNNKTTTQKAYDEFIETKLGCSIKVISSMCGAEFFGTLDQRDITKFILDILPVSISFEKLIEFAEEQIDKKLDESEIEFLRKRFNTTATIDLLDIEKAYLCMVDERKAAKKTLKLLEAKASFDKTKLPTVTKDGLNKRLSEITLNETKYKDFQKNLEAYEKARMKKQEAEGKLAKLKEELITYDAITKPSEEELETAKSDKQKFVDAVKKSENIIATNNANISMFKKTLNNLDKSTCPLSDKLICSTDKTGLKSELSLLIQKNEDAISQAQDFIQKCNEQITKRDTIIEQYNKNAVMWAKKEALVKQINDFVIPALLEAPEKCDSEDCSDEKKDIQNKIRIWTEYETSLEYEKDFEKVFKEVSMLEFGVKILDVKNGVRSKILEKSLLPIENIVNTKADSLRKGFKMSFASPNGMEIRVSPKGNDFIPMDKISSGEFILAAYLLMCTIKEITGASILIIDNIDKLDKETANSFIDIIKHNNEFETVFIAGVNHTDTVSLIDTTTTVNTNLIKL